MSPYILPPPASELSLEERAEVEKVAPECLTKLKQLLVLDWRQKSTARSQLQLTIEDVMDTGLPRSYWTELYQQKCSAVLEHVCESYPERDTGVYAAAQWWKAEVRLRCPRLLSVGEERPFVVHRKGGAFDGAGGSAGTLPLHVEFGTFPRIGCADLPA